VRSVPSPVDPSKVYHEVNILFANSIDFGMQDATMSMIAMHTVHARGKVQLMLNLDRKELDIQFPLTVSSKTRRFRFRLPIALLSHVYKDPNCDSGQTALVIPYNSPPQFFMQRYEGEKMKNGKIHTSFSTKENMWIEWHTWFRETNVVDAGLEKILQEMPLMNHRGSAIIDIGQFLSLDPNVRFLNTLRPLE
jgi:RNA-dependent RNA polymerase